MSNLEFLQLRRRIDRLLEPWRGGSTPGCTIGVVRDGTLILHRHAGLADLGLGVPIGPDTTFRVASVSKQFTCAMILLLAREGRLSLEDEIHTHLPDLPGLGAPISIDQLMHNTSGIRDFLQLMHLGGAELEQPCRSQDVMQILARQRDLNFLPGIRFLYSNTNFLLLGLIVEKLSGMSLTEFAEQRIFGPLGMSRSRFVPGTRETAPGLASGYFPKPEGGFIRAAHGFPLGGEGGLVSSVEDLALWDRNFTTCQIGGRALVAALTETTALNNGEISLYARGLAVKSYRGLRTVSHGGLWPGYRTEFLRVPERALTVIVIANLGTIVPYALARTVVDVALENERILLPVPPLPTREEIDRLTGRYLDPDGPATLEIDRSPDGRPAVTCNGVPFALVPDGTGRFKADSSSFELALTPTAEGVSVERVPGHATHFVRLPEVAALPADLPGCYTSDAVASSWTIAPDSQGRMAVAVSGPLVSGRSWEVSPIAEDVVRIWAPSQLYRSWFDVRIERGSSGAIGGLRVNSGRADGQFFARHPAPPEANRR